MADLAQKNLHLTQPSGTSLSHTAVKVRKTQKTPSLTLYSVKGDKSGSGEGLRWVLPRYTCIHVGCGWSLSDTTVGGTPVGYWSSISLQATT